MRFPVRKCVAQVLAVFTAICALQNQSTSAQASPRSEQQPIITFQSRVDLVLVPVVVTDAKGQRAKDLSVYDFTILENSRPLAIKHFEWIHGERSPAPNHADPGLFSNAVPAGTLQPSITIFLLDSLNSTVADQKTACEAMSKILSSPVSGPTAIWQLGPRGIVVVQDFTVVEEELAAAVHRLTVARSAQDLLNTTAVADHRPFFNGRTERDYSGYLHQEIDVDTEERFNQMAVQDADRITRDTVLRIARALRSVEGRKSIVWATGGLSTSIEDEIANELAAANVAVYPIELTPTQNSRSSPAHFNNRVRYAKIQANGLKNVAAATGGSYCAYAGAAPDCMANAIADSRDYYLLSFSIDRRHLKPGPHQIQVKVRDPGLKVRARTAYFVEDRSSGDRSSRWAEVESAVDVPLDYTSLPFAVLWVDRHEAKDKLTLSFRYLLPALGLEPHDGNGAALDLSFAAIAVTREGRRAGSFSKDFAGQLSSETTAQMREHGVVLDGAIEVEYSASTVRFVVRDNLTGRMGSLSVPISAR
jgi:VWFA-related protein